MTAVLAACGGGSASDPPPSVALTAGDSRAVISWAAESGVEYWVFYATDPSISPTNFVNVPNSHVLRNIGSPLAVTGLVNGVTYYFTINGRRDNGPGGAGSPVQAVTPGPPAACGRPARP